MPKFLDVHSLKDLDERTLRKTQDAPKDEFGVTHDNVLYNREEDRFYCLLDAPSKEAVLKHFDLLQRQSLIQPLCIISSPLRYTVYGRLL